MSEGEEVRIINFRRQVAAGLRVLLEATSPVTGYITHVTFHFPPGCLSLVHVRVLLQREPVWPLPEEYIALDNATVTYQFKFGQKVKKSDYIGCEIVNNDTVNAHTVSVIVVTEGKL